MTKCDILKASSYSDVFKDKDNLKKEYAALILEYHPDKSSDPDALRVSIKLNQLYAEAKAHLKDDTWGASSNVLLIKKTEDTSQKIVYRYSFDSEVGKVYIGTYFVTYQFDDKKYYDRYLDAIGSIKYKDSAMEEYFSQFLPKVHDRFESLDGKYYIALRKTEEVYPLNLVVDVLSKKEHAAWVMTRLLNLCVLLYTNGFVHNGICIDNCFVSLEHHGLSLLGGWQFACPEGVRMVGTNSEIYENLPADIKSDKLARYIVDIECSKMVVKKLLGGNSFLNLEKLCGESMARFLTETKRKNVRLSDSTGHYFTIKGEIVEEVERTPLDELREWEKVRSETFPKHEFVKIDGITADDVFKKGVMN